MTRTSTPAFLRSMTALIRLSSVKVNCFDQKRSLRRFDEFANRFQAVVGLDDQTRVQTEA